MRLSINVLLIIVSMILFLWAAAVFADVMSYGTPTVLTTLGLTTFAASFLDYGRPVH